MPSVLLNMIVKDEAHVIEKTLANLCDKIKFDYWVISDTGSTDTTKALITAFFDARGIKGELFDDEWKDFGHNRSKALEHAYNKSDYLFVFDADDALVGDFALPAIMDADSYHLHFGSNDTSYWRICMVNNRKRWKYVGVIHEYIECLDNSKANKYILGEYHVSHGTTGNRSTDPKKYSKDAIILEKAYKELAPSDPLRNRYAFYCANSYKDACDVNNAIIWYKTTIGLDGGWDQEKYVSCIRLYDLLEKSSIETALFYAIQSYKFDPTRIEGIAKLVRYYCAKDMSDVAHAFYKLVENWYITNYLLTGGNKLTDTLFVDLADYDFFLPYYMIIVSDRIKKQSIGIQMYNFLFTNKKTGPAWFMNNLLHNFQFFVKHVDKANRKELGAKANDYLRFLELKNVPVKDVFYTSIYELIK